MQVRLEVIPVSTTHPAGTGTGPWRYLIHDIAGVIPDRTAESFEASVTFTDVGVGDYEASVVRLSGTGSPIGGIGSGMFSVTPAPPPDEVIETASGITITLSPDAAPTVASKAAVRR